jgi:hypothetical protein
VFAKEKEVEDIRVNNASINQLSSRSERGNNISEKKSSKPENPMAALSGICVYLGTLAISPRGSSQRLWGGRLDRLWRLRQSWRTQQVPIGTVFWNKKHTPPAGIGDRPVLGLEFGLSLLVSLESRSAPLPTAIACSVHHGLR